MNFSTTTNLVESKILVMINRIDFSVPEVSGQAASSFEMTVHWLVCWGERKRAQSARFLSPHSQPGALSFRLKKRSEASFGGRNLSIRQLAVRNLFTVIAIIYIHKNGSKT